MRPRFGITIPSYNQQKLISVIYIRMNGAMKREAVQQLCVPDCSLALMAETYHYTDEGLMPKE